MANISDRANFKEMRDYHNLAIKRNSIKTVQINIGKRCNQSCIHCHVDAGPNRMENMDKKTAYRLVKLIAKAPYVETIDLTGGAPELNPNFRPIITAVSKMGKEIINRTNLTVFFEPGQEDTIEFLANNKVQIFASLPCYTKKNVDKQRGKGVHAKSIRALKILNDLGYGKKNSGLILNLVYNPLKAVLPAPQSQLENDYKVRLKEDFGIKFNHLLTITNMPIGKFFKLLAKEGLLEKYNRLLVKNFNKKIVKDVMCTEMISISWDGYIYDCDFNQMLEMPIGKKQTSLWDINHFNELSNDISVDNHCYGCTAGAGSSCIGALK
jgi:radical SAM/Cys-rich protein